MTYNVFSGTLNPTHFTSPGHIVLDRDPGPPPPKGHSRPIFCPVLWRLVLCVMLMCSRDLTLVSRTHAVWSSFTSLVHNVLGLQITVFVYFTSVWCFYRQHLRAAQTCRYLVYSEADFEVFRPAGATRCTDGAKFKVPSSVPNFTPIGATTRV